MPEERRLISDEISHAIFALLDKNIKTAMAQVAFLLATIWDVDCENNGKVQGTTIDVGADSFKHKGWRIRIEPAFLQRKPR